MKKTFAIFWTILCPLLCFAQINHLSVATPEKFVAKAGGTGESKLTLQLRPGFHVNSNTPSDDYLIPLKITWAAGPLQVVEVTYPKPKMEKYSFSEKPISVFSGDFVVVTKFKAPSDAPAGTVAVTGKLRYQACNDTMCFPPKTIEVSQAVEIVK
jgi:Disulphide bond corrector protein DsbC.